MATWTTPEIRATEFTAALLGGSCQCSCNGGAGAGSGTGN